MKKSYAIEQKKETARAMQELARHEMIVRLEQDILMDMAICDIEGWDKMEFINQIGELIDHFRR